MAVRGRTPEKGTRGVTFTHDKCSGKCARHGWLSGDVHILPSHVGKGPSKPCEKELLGRKAKCPGCAEERATADLGYVPLRDQTGRPVCVVVRKARIQFVGNLRLGSPVTYGRDEGRFEGVYVIPRPVDLKWENYFSHPPADDMGYWLPLFLGVPHLGAAMREWWRSAGKCQPVVTPDEPLPPALVDVVPTPVTARGEGHARRVNAELDVIEGMIKGKVAKMRREDAEKNGAH